MVLKKDKLYKSWQLSISWPKAKKPNISDAVKAENVLRDYIIKKDENKDEDKEIIENMTWLNTEDYKSHIAIFAKNNIKTSSISFTLSSKAKKESKESIYTLISKKVNPDKTRYKIYEFGSREVRALFVGEYLHGDFIDMGLEKLFFNNEIKVKIN